MNKQIYSQTTINGTIIISFKVDKNSHFNDRELKSMLRTRFNENTNEFHIAFIDGETPIIMIEEK